MYNHDNIERNWNNLITKLNEGHSRVDGKWFDYVRSKYTGNLLPRTSYSDTNMGELEHTGWDSKEEAERVYDGYRYPGGDIVIMTKAEAEADPNYVPSDGNHYYAYEESQNSISPITYMTPGGPTKFPYLNREEGEADNAGDNNIVILTSSEARNHPKYKAPTPDPRMNGGARSWSS